MEGRKKGDGERREGVKKMKKVKSAGGKKKGKKGGKKKRPDCISGLGARGFDPQFMI